MIVFLSILRETVMTTFGMRLRKLRKVWKISQPTLAQELQQRGVKASRSLVALWEQGRSDPSTFHLIALARFFQVSVDYLLGLTDEKSNLIASREKLKEELEFKGEADASLGPSAQNLLKCWGVLSVTIKRVEHGTFPPGTRVRILEHQGDMVLVEMGKVGGPKFPIPQGLVKDIRWVPPEESQKPLKKIQQKLQSQGKVKRRRPTMRGEAGQRRGQKMESPQQVRTRAQQSLRWLKGIFRWIGRTETALAVMRLFRQPK